MQGRSADWVQRGSSPLTRGKLYRRREAPPQRRLIPAHAGKTPLACAAPRRSAAHPRSRGENEIARAEDVNANGSSPLTRGKPPRRQRPGNTPGLIPAHAGKTSGRGLSALSAPAHPRSRGENGVLANRRGNGTGSSPLTRGKLSALTDRRRPRRLIPAHAGKTRRRPARTSGCRAHPRSRGENSRVRHDETEEDGSSPLTRGKLPN